MFDVRGERKKEKKKEKKSPGQSERVQNFQINFKPLSPASAKPQQLSCCDLILFFLPCHPFFPRLNTSFLLKKTVPKLAGAKNNRRRSPKEANIPRTSTSSVRSCAESAPRTPGLEKHGAANQWRSSANLSIVAKACDSLLRPEKQNRKFILIRGTLLHSIYCKDLYRDLGEKKTHFLVSFPLF